MVSRIGSLAKVDCLKCRCSLPAVASFFLASPLLEWTKTKSVMRREASGGNDVDTRMHGGRRIGTLFEAHRRPTV